MPTPTAAILRSFEFYEATEEDPLDAPRNKIGLRAAFDIMQSEPPHRIHMEIAMRLPELPNLIRVDDMTRWLLGKLHVAIVDATEQLPAVRR